MVTFVLAKESTLQRRYSPVDSEHYGIGVNSPCRAPEGQRAFCFSLHPITMNTRILIVFAALLTASTVVASGPFPTGGRPFYIPNQTGHRGPQIPTDLLSITLDGLQVPRETRLFTNDNTLGISAEMIVNYRQIRAGEAPVDRPVTVTKAMKFDVTKDDEGNVVIAIRKGSLVDSIPMMIVNDTERSYISYVTMNVKLLVEKGHSGFSKAVNEVFSLSTLIPIPNPYTKYVDILGKGLSQLSQSAINEGSNPNALSIIGYQFLVNGTREADKSGYYVLLMSSDEQGEGWISDPRTIDASKLAFNEATGLSYDGKLCRNAYAVFTLSFSQLPTFGGLEPSHVLALMEKEGKSLEEKAKTSKLNFASTLALQKLDLSKLQQAADVLGKASNEIDAIQQARGFKNQIRQAPKIDSLQD